MRILHYFLIIILPIVIVLGNFRYLVFNTFLHQKFQEKAGVYSNFQDQSEVKPQTGNLIGYYRGKNSLDHNFFSNQAMVHLTNVKNLIVVANNLLYVCFFVATLISIFLLVKGKYKELFQALFISSLSTIVFIVLLAAGLFTIFDPLFTKFHQTLFTNDLWMFDATDNVIKLFPQEFFVQFANTLAINILITSAIITVLAFCFRKIAK